MAANPNRSSRQPARGERAALIGYHAQYRGAAALLLQVIDQPGFEFVRIADPSAGRVDDWQVFTRHRLDAYQFKWSKYPRSFNLSGLTSNRKDEPPLIKTLADGWRERTNSFPERKIEIHLVTNGYPSVSPLKLGQGNELGEEHFAAFLADSWEAVHDGTKSIPLPGMPWAEVWWSILSASGLSRDELGAFVRSCHLRFEFDTDAPTGYSLLEKRAWEATVRTFTERLVKAPSVQAPLITLNRSQLWDLFGRDSSAIPPHLHEFRLDPNATKPLRKAGEALEQSLASISTGYICLSGSPGSGKSCTLTLVLRRSAERVIHYYAYTPDSPNANQGESASFYSLLVDELCQAGFPPKGTAPHNGALPLLKERFKEQLHQLSAHYAASGRKTIFLVDGLDHIEREQSPDRSLLKDLPSPGEIPEGVVFLLGTQSRQILRADIRQSFRDPQRNLETTQMDALQVEGILQASKSGPLLNPHDLERASQIAAGHPLALGYLLRKLDACISAGDVDAILAAEPAFTGNILGSYQAYWDQLGGSGFKVKRLLGHLARLRRPADFDWLSGWADPEALDQLHSRFSHYFERSTSSWQFFHNSFRVFVLEATCEDSSGNRIEENHRSFHRELAEFSASSPPGSPWRAEEFHHLVEAGLADRALAIAEPAWFRSQFFAMRGQAEILADLHKAQSLAASERSGLHVCRLTIAESEITSRFEALDFDSDRMVRILLEAGKVAEAMRFIRTEKKLHVNNEVALEVCELLREMGEEGEAAKVFELINPYSPGLHGPAESYTGLQRRMMANWGLTAARFLPLGEILSVFNHCVFKPGDACGGMTSHPREPDQAVERAKAAALLARRAAEQGATQFTDAIAEHVDWKIVPFGFRLNYIISKLKHQLDEGGGIPTNAEGSHVLMLELLQLVGHAKDARRLPALEVLLRAGESEAVRELFLEIDAEEIARGLGALSSSDQPERTARAWLRVAFALGEHELAKSLFLPSSPGGKVSSALSESHLSVAALHAGAWRNEPVSETSLERHFAQILTPLARGFSDADRWSEVLRSISGILDDLVAACVAHGPSAIASLCDFLSRQWKSPHGRRGWPLGIQRRLLHDLVCAGANSAWTAEWLETCESGIDTAAASGTRVSELIDQADAWLAAGEASRALKAANQAFRLSLGIGYHKDYQLTSWISFLRRSWKQEWRSATPLITQIARSVAGLRHGTHGGAMGDAAELLVTSCFHAEPALGLRIWDYFRDEGETSFPDILTAILKSPSDRPDDDPLIAFHILCDVLVPVLDSSAPDLVAHILARLFHRYGAAETQEAAARLSTRINALARAEYRAGWWRGLRRASKQLGLVLPAAPDDMTSHEDSREEATEEAVTRISESPDPVETFREIIEEHRTRETQHGHSSYLDLRRVAESLATTIPADQIARCRILLSGESYVAVAMVEALAARGSAPSISLNLWDWAKELLTAAHEKAGMSGPYEHEIRPLYVAMLAAEPAKARELLFKSLRANHWFGPPSLDQLAHHLIQLPSDLNDFSREVSEHVSLLLQGLADDAPPLADEELNELPATSPATALMRLVFIWLDLPSGVVRHGARRVFRQLCRSANATWQAELEHCLNGATEAPVVLSLLEATSTDELQPMSRVLLPALAQLARSADFESRALARSLLSKLGGEVPRFTVAKPLHPSFRLVLPRYADPGPIGKYMGAFVGTCSRMTGIPEANIYRRIDEWEEELPDPDSRDRQTLGRQLADIGLHFGFMPPEKQLCWRIAFRILAEFQDAGLVPEKDMLRLLQVLSQQDHFLSDIAPDTHPLYLPILEPEQYSRAWSEEWLDLCDDHPLSSAPVTDRGWIVAAYRHSFRVPTDHRPYEEHVAFHFRKTSPESADNLNPADLIGWDQPEKSSDYYTWTEMTDEGDEPLFVVGGQSMDIPSPPWLALHPGRARELGWRADPTSLFGWKAASGARMAQSRWWSNGPFQCTSTHGNRITAAGWIVVLAPEGFSALEERFGQLTFTSFAERHHAC